MYKTLTKKLVARDMRFVVDYDPKTFKYGIVEKKTGKFVSKDRWLLRKFAEEYLTIMLAFDREL